MENKRPKQDEAAPTLVLFHKNCPSGDGFGAAFAAWLALGDSARYIPLDYGDEPPDASGADVHILDLSFPKPVMERLGSQARSITLLDHHLSAMRSLGTFKPACCASIRFDMDSCGAAMAWRHFHPGKELPKLFAHIQDRDLWRWEIPGSADYLAWLDCVPKDFESWKGVLEMDGNAEERAMADGAAMARQSERMSRQMADGGAPIDIGGAKGLMANVPGELRSRVGSLLAERSGTFGAAWRVAEDGSVLVSLRSLGGCDVEAIAKAYGGGGHKSSASFKLPPEALPLLAKGRIETPGA